VDRDSDHETVIAISARVDGINVPQYPAARVGVMIRKFDQEGDQSVRRFAALVMTNQSQALFVHRDQEGGIVQQDEPIDVALPCFARLTATRNDGLPGICKFKAELSQDNSNWRIVNSPTRIAMDGRLMIGLVVTAQTGTTSEAAIGEAHASFSKIEVFPAISNVTVD
jgi:hypothetical protein